MPNGETAQVESHAVAEDDKIFTIQTRKKLVRARGDNQRVYMQSIHNHDLAFGIGPAGTGKTYLAVASAIDALENEQPIRRKKKKSIPSVLS